VDDPAGCRLLERSGELAAPRGVRLADQPGDFVVAERLRPEFEEYRGPAPLLVREERGQHVAQPIGARRVSIGGGELVSIAVQTAVVDVLASGEFCNPRRRIAHLLGMYGFVLYVLATVVLVFQPSASPIWSQLWWLGGLMICVGGYWFWFFIRVDVLAEGNSPLRIVRADLFILSLLASVTLGLVWAAAGGGTGALFGLYILATTVLFGSVPWSKFAHMFFKPAAALQKRVANANGSRSNLPAPADKPATLGNPRRQPSHY